jgi:dinuclear metal center YbgI/SA1388 family protein
MKTNFLLNKLAKRFPKRIAKKYHDFVGKMTGDKPEEINKILICLDLEWEILPLVKEHKPDLIITHHPFIYGTKYQLFKRDLSKKDLCEEIDILGIAVYSFHTNFDEGKGGMNDALASALKLQDIYAPEKDLMMRIGTLKEEMDVLEFAKFAKETLNVEYSLLIDAGSRNIKKVGIVGGGGSRTWKIAKDEGCDIYISGDAPHHVRRDIVNTHFNYLDMPHEIEKIFIPTMKKIILDLDENVEIVTIDNQKLPKVI